MKTKRVELPLQLIGSLSIVACMLLLAVVLIAESFFSNKAALLAAAEKNAQQMAESVDLQLDRIFQSNINTIRLLEQDPLNHALSYEQREKRLKTLARILQSNEILSAVYAGYTDGDFFSLRPLRQDGIKQRLNAPEQTTYLLQSIDLDPQGTRLRASWTFYDNGFNVLQTRPSEAAPFDPRSRPWFKQASNNQDVIVTEPYLFSGTQQIGVTLSYANADTGTVIGMDIAINDLSHLMASLKPPGNNHILIVDELNRVVGYPDQSKLMLSDEQGNPRLASVRELDIPGLESFADITTVSSTLTEKQTSEGSWYGLSIPIKDHSINLDKSNTGANTGSNTEPNAGQPRFIFATPKASLLADANQRLTEQLIWSAFTIAILLIVGWRAGRFIAKPMHQLLDAVESIRHFDFKHDFKVSSSVREVNQLSEMINSMARGIDNFKSISKTLSAENDLDRMLDQVVAHLIHITAAGAGAVYLYDTKARHFTRVSHIGMQGPEQIGCGGTTTHQVSQTLSNALGLSEDKLLSTPLRDSDGSLLGVFVLQCPAITGSSPLLFRQFVEEISGSAATAMQTRKHAQEQDDLIEAIIRLLADAIDAKSPYTGGHCERVPELAELMISAAEQSDAAEFKDFQMSEKERREFRIAAWLHDCGKVTSPEYVVDKATKLETIYNRIHEIRTRFEVLWRDAEISYWQGLAEGLDQSELIKQKEALQAQLRQEFDFIAQANIGGEFMSDDDIARLESISQRQWLRFFDNQIGLSRDELKRMPAVSANSNATNLPVVEQLLENKSYHKIGWQEHRPAVEKDNPDNIWGFDMSLPEYQFDQGELHNLTIRRGTLTDEERFAVNDHIVQTIRILSALPFPKDLQRVPEIAGNHHEKMDGTGYPRRLNASELSLEERVMAVADVFEALTAADRPYKDAKKLSEAIRILAFMVKDQHLDGTVFRLFLESNVYSQYAQRFLTAEQIDQIDIQAMLELAGLQPQVEYS